MFMVIFLIFEYSIQIIEYSIEYSTGFLYSNIEYLNVFIFEYSIPSLTRRISTVLAEIPPKKGRISTVLGEIRSFWKNFDHIYGRVLNCVDSAQMAEIFNYCVRRD
jgi:hypothetical protein